MKIMLLGSGELGKEFAISAKRLGLTIIAVDSYDNAPAQQVSDIKVVCNMKDAEELKKCVNQYKPDIIVPEIEAINTEVLYEFERNGIQVTPSAKAVNLTMNRDSIRNYVVEHCPSIRTARFDYAETVEEFLCITSNFDKFVVKPCMSSSGKGQSVVTSHDHDILVAAWDYAISGMRGDRKKVIIEEFIDFDLEVTQLTILDKRGNISFCHPIVHYQEDGDYKWSSHNIGEDFIIDDDAIKSLQEQASEVVESISKYPNEQVQGAGIFGVEFFMKKDKATNKLIPIFSELSPRPHDTGMVTMYSQDVSQFELHLKAILGADIDTDDIEHYGGVSVTINTDKESGDFTIPLEKVIYVYNRDTDAKICFFGKEECRRGRRMGVVLGRYLEQCLKIRDVLTSD